MGTTTERVDWILSARDSASQVFRQTETSLGRLQSQYERFSGLIAGFAGGAVIQQMAQAVLEAERASVRLDAVLQATRRSAGLTRAELAKMNDELVAVTIFDDESITEAQASLLKFGNVQQQVFERALKLSADYATFMGTNIPEAAQQLGRALQSPTEGTMLLERNIGKLNFTQKEHIKNLSEQGKLWDAQNAVLDLIEGKIGGTAAAMNTGLTGATKSVTKAWGDLMEAMGKLPRVNGGIEGLASLLRDIRLTIEGTRNPLQMWVLDFAKLIDESSTVLRLVGAGDLMRKAVTRSSVSGVIRTPGKDAAEAAQAAADARREFEENARRERAAEQAKKAKEAADRQAKLFQSTEQGLQREALAVQDLTRYEEVLAEIQAGRYGTLTAAQKMRLLDLAAEVTQNKALAEQEKERLEAIKVGQEERAKWKTAEAELRKTRSEAADDYIRGLNEQMAMQQLELSLMGKSEVERATAIEQFKIELAVRERIRDLQKDGIALGEKENEIRAAGERAKGLAAEHVAMQKRIEDARRAGQVIEESLTDSILRGFERGEGAAENFINSLKNMFRTLVLRPIVQPIAATAAGAVTGLFGLPQVASANTGGGLLGTAGNLAGLANAGASFFGIGGTSSMTVMAAEGMKSLAMQMGSQTLMDAGTALASGTGALGALGTAIPYVGAALLAYQLFKGNGGTPSYALPDSTGSQARMSSQYAALLGQFGGTGSANFTYYANTGRDSQNPNFGVGAYLNGRQLFQVGEDYAGGLQRLTPENLALQEARAIVTALQSSELPKYLKDYFDTLTPAAMDKGALDTALAFAQQLKSISEQLATMGMSAASASDGLITLLGAFGNAPDLLNSYYQNFVSEGERTANTWRQIDEQLAKLGAGSLPRTREEFRALVEAQDLSSDAGQRMFAGLMQLAPAFASVTEAIAETVTVAQQLQSAMSAAGDAVDRQIQATTSAAAAARQSADSYRNIAEALQAAIDRIMGGGGVGAAGRFEALFTTAMQGDAGAMSGLPAAAADFLEASRSSARTAIEYARDRARVVGMLEQAGVTATGMANWQDYQATLLQTQANLLEQIRDQLDQPSPDAAILQQQADLLGTISTLLQEQTVQIVQGSQLYAMMTRDQTSVLGGYLDGAAASIAGNNTREANAVRDALAILRATTADGLISATEASPTRAALAQLQSSTGTLLTASITAEQQAALEAAAQGAKLVQTTAAVGGAVQDQTGKVISGNSTQDAIRNITALNNSISEEMLRQLVMGSGTQNSTLQSVLDGSAQTVALLQQLVDLTAQEVAESAAAAAARQAAYEAELEASRRAAAEKAAQDAAAAAAAAAAATSTAATTATTRRTFEEYAAAQGYVVSYGDDGNLRLYDSDGGRFLGVSSLYDQYLSSFANGGLARGLSIVGERGPEIVDFGSPARVYTAEQTRGMFAPRDDSALIAELRTLRTELAAIRRQTQKTSDLLTRVTRDGESVVTTPA